MRIPYHRIVLHPYFLCLGLHCCNATTYPITTLQQTTNTCLPPTAAAIATGVREYLVVAVQLVFFFSQLRSLGFRIGLVCDYCIPVNVCIPHSSILTSQFFLFFLEPRCTTGVLHTIKVIRFDFPRYQLPLQPASFTRSTIQHCAASSPGTQSRAVLGPAPDVPRHRTRPYHTTASTTKSLTSFFNLLLLVRTPE